MGVVVAGVLSRQLILDHALSSLEHSRRDGHGVGAAGLCLGVAVPAASSGAAACLLCWLGARPLAQPVTRSCLPARVAVAVGPGQAVLLLGTSSVAAQRLPAKASRDGVVDAVQPLYAPGGVPVCSVRWRWGSLCDCWCNTVPCPAS